MLSKIKKPNAFLMKLAFLFMIIGILASGLLFQAVDRPDMHFFFQKLPSAMPSFMFVLCPLISITLLTIFMPSYEDSKLSAMSVWVGIPVVVIMAVVSLYHSVFYGAGLANYLIFFNTHTEIQPVTLSEIDEIYSTNGYALIYVTNENYPDADVDERIYQITQNYPVYMLHYTQEDAEVTGTLRKLDTVQAPFVIAIFARPQGFEQQYFTAQEIIDTNLEAHINHWAHGGLYFTKQATGIQGL